MQEVAPQFRAISLPESALCVLLSSLELGTYGGAERAVTEIEMGLAGREENVQLLHCARRQGMAFQLVAKC